MKRLVVFFIKKIFLYEIVFVIGLYLLSKYSIEQTGYNMKLYFLFGAVFGVLSGLRLYFLKGVNIRYSWDKKFLHLADVIGYLYYIYAINVIAYILVNYHLLPVYIPTGFHGTEIILTGLIFLLFYTLQLNTHSRVLFALLPVFFLWGLAWGYYYILQDLPLYPNIYDWFKNISIINQSIFMIVMILCCSIPIFIRSKIFHLQKTANNRRGIIQAILLFLVILGFLFLSPKFVHFRGYGQSTTRILQQNGLLTTMLVLPFLTDTAHNKYLTTGE